MHIMKNLRKDQETILRFLDAFGGGSAALGAGNKHAHAGFFMLASTFIQEYIDGTFFQKEELLMKALESFGLPPDEGAIGATRNEQRKSREAAELLLKAAQEWHGGDEGARIEVGWAASEYTSTLRQNLNRLKNLVFPLLEQNISPEEEILIVEGLNKIALENSMKNAPEKYNKLIETLEEELKDWR
jgi:hemerythrin-like domain-containing protein